MILNNSLYNTFIAMIIIITLIHLV